MRMIPHHFTVDVEEYFQVSAFEKAVPRDRWFGIESRASIGVRRLLELLERHHTRGTFFVLGWLAHRRPELVREIAFAGHEIASHGWDHRRVTSQEPREFRASVRNTKQELEDLIGASVRGFRAPSYSIVPGFEWALDILVEEGYQYDSSLFPVRRPGGYGYPSALPDPHEMVCPAGRLVEVPPATLRRGGINVPAGGGAWFRVFPYAVVRHALEDCEARGVPGTFYIHPWELDPDQPRVAASWLSRLRHYSGLARTMPRLERLLGEFRFTSIGHSLGMA